ncbi:hypothetical protein OUZ56_026328 [Daphnia magna]|uniref:Secreted protein n=1 Tax=Daphnia magna TaxID=35525 RepID=A0ABQ9ZLE3_9CRUS|nr:hypothetical protein OUZ56_026328 [Daphnia magna]
MLRATKSHLSSSCKTLLVLFLWGATKWEKPEKWEASPLARLVPLHGPLLSKTHGYNSVFTLNTRMLKLMKCIHIEYKYISCILHIEVKPHEVEAHEVEAHEV